MIEEEIKTEEISKKKGWAQRYSESKHADKWLGFFSFIESSIFPLPPSTLMVAIMSSNGKHKKWLYYGTITTIFSVLGGIFGYLVGVFFYDTLGQTIIITYGLESDIERVGEMFKNNAFLAILIAAFTPIPYKVFTLAGGFFKINLIIFITASIIGRGARFYVVAYLMNILGDRLSKKTMDRINLGALIIATIVVLYFFYEILTI